MPSRPLNRGPLRNTLGGAAVLALAALPAYGQYSTPPRSPSPYCPSATQLVSAEAPGLPEPAATPQTPQAPPAPAQQPAAPDLSQPPAEPGLADQRFAGLGGEQVAVPNMIGDLLGGSRSVSFFIQRLSGPVSVEASGFTALSNPKVADNNSPLPRDRLAFRYNFFADALAVRGIGSGPPVLDPTGTFFREATATRLYNVDQFTFSAEKTFLDGRCSAELRVPFSRTLASSLDLSAGDVVARGPETDAFGNPILTVAPTPENTLGRRDTEFGDLSLVLKALCYCSPRLALSGGLGVGIPTADDTRVRVRDFLGISAVTVGGTPIFTPQGPLGPGTPIFTGVNPANPGAALHYRPGPDASGGPRLARQGFAAPPTVPVANPNRISLERVREFEIDNETWSLSPFLAALVTPGDRLFVQGFLQFDVPTNASQVTFREPNTAVGFVRVPGSPPDVLQPPFEVTDRIREQALLQTDVGVGYWLLLDPQRRWFTGVAPTLELHYTTTLEDADLVVLPRDPAFQRTTAVFESSPPPVVGNLRNRVDILDLTVGSTVLVGSRATVAAGFAFPLRGGDDRVFDWEFQLQVNYFFGANPGARRGGGF